jgi:hypothetical protein
MKKGMEIKVYLRCGFIFKGVPELDSYLKNRFYEITVYRFKKRHILKLEEFKN